MIDRKNPVPAWRVRVLEFVLEQWCFCSSFVAMCDFAKNGFSRR